ncbi:MAG: alpha/beta fold hydrolase [Dehalococcoidia bacterium]|nr:alpha/beta fold hydrolase [Dehalococcoidia bacterium]
MPIQSISAFFVGTAPYQMYVERLNPMPGRPKPFPLIFVHGGCHNGAYWISRPDGEPGWAPYFCEQGWTVYMVDWPGHGRSGFMPDFIHLSAQSVVDDLVILLQKVGPAILMTHSMSGPIGWKTADTVPNLVRGIVGCAPGRPANLQDSAERSAMPPDSPVWFTPEEAHEFWASSEMFPPEWLTAYDRAIMPESPQALNERRHAGGARGLYVESPERLKSIPKLVVTGDQDPRHPREMDEPITEYLGGDYLWLADRGIRGHSHMFMIELGHIEIARLIEDWLEEKGLA